MPWWVWPWIVLGPVLPVALGLALLSTWRWRIVAATAVVVAEAVVFAQAAASEDRTALGFTFAFLPVYASTGVVGLAVVERIVLALVGGPRPRSTVGDRLAALAVDALLLLLVARWIGAEVWVSLAGAVAYLTAGVATGGTVGHRLLGLRVVDATTGGRLPSAMALVRSLLVVAEVAGAPFLVPLAVAWADVASAMGDDGLSFGDRLVGSRVVRAQRHTEPD